MTRMRTAATIAILVAAALLLSGQGAAAGPGVHRGLAVPGEIVVGFKSGVGPTARAAARSAARVHAERSLLVHRAQLVKVDSGQSVTAAIAALKRRSEVHYAEPNWIVHASSITPNDPLFGSQWGLNNTGQMVNGHAGVADADIDAPEAWDLGHGEPSTVVAVVDSGVAYDHPDLAPNMWTNTAEIPGNGIDDDHDGKVDDVRGWDFVDNDNNPWDFNDHGTHVAGIIAASGNNGVGISGVAWQASIMPVRVLDATGSGTLANIVDGLGYASTHGAKVVNASFALSADSPALEDVITSHPDTLFVAAAGNGASDVGHNDDTTPTYPCDSPAANLICVAATDNTDALASFSNYGATSVDLGAPGVDIESTRPHYVTPDPFSDDFESGLGKWTVQSGNWGTQSVLSTNWLVDSPNANYANNADWAIRTTAKVDLTGRDDCALRFTYASFLEQNFDWFYVQASSDGTTWHNLVQLGDTNGAIGTHTLPLGAAGSSYYRFRLTSDGATNSDGVYIDNVRIMCPGGTYGAGDYQLLSGASIATAFVSGAAAVLFSAKPAATVARVKELLLNTGDPVPGLAGKTVSGRRLNLNAALTALLAKADTTTTITSAAPDPSVAGDPVTVHFSVAPTTAGPGTPTGNVTVSDGVDSCTATVVAGSCSVSLTTVGARSLTASYSGDSDFKGSTSGPLTHTVNQPSAPPSTTPAHLSNLRTTHRRFRAAATPGAAASNRHHPPVGTTFRYTLDRAATVRFDFIQPRAGRKVNGKCVARKRSNQRKPSCTLLRGSQTLTGHAGVNSVRFNGWLSRTRKLAPGRYTLVAAAITSGVATTPQRLRFTIAR